MFTIVDVVRIRILFIIFAYSRSRVRLSLLLFLFYLLEAFEGGMRFTIFSLNHEKVFNEGSFVEVNSCEWRHNEAGQKERSTDSTDVNKQVRQHVNMLLQVLCLFAQLNRYFKGFTLSIIYRVLRVVSLICLACHIEPSLFLCLSQFREATPVRVMCQHALFEVYFHAHKEVW